jgi:hypothetical protein
VLASKAAIEIGADPAGISDVVRWPIIAEELAMALAHSSALTRPEGRLRRQPAVRLVGVLTRRALAVGSALITRVGNATVSGWQVRPIDRSINGSPRVLAKPSCVAVVTIWSWAEINA